jgi:hypothetical protein
MAGEKIGFALTRGGRVIYQQDATAAIGREHRSLGFSQTSGHSHNEHGNEMVLPLAMVSYCD